VGDVRFEVKKYIDEGWSVIPIPKGSKAPEIKDWVNRTFKVEDFEEESNVGVRLGKPSGHLTDVDLDCPEAVKAAPFLLPLTERQHGRPATGTSHYFYYCEGAKSERWTDVDGKVLVEIRSTGGQTVIPPSVHPSGDVLFWAAERTPATIEYNPLRNHGRATATAALLGRHWPGQGSRHACASHLAGFLAARDLDLGIICKIVEAACTIAGDVAELDDRIRAAADTVKNFAAGRKIAGGPSLEDHIGKEMVALLLKWYGGNSAIHDKLIDEMNAKHFVARIGKDDVIVTIEDDAFVFQKEYSLHLRYANQKIQVGTKSRGENKGEPIYKTKFEIWREHPRRLTYRTVTFAPPPLVASPEDFNLWTGFALMPLRPTPEEKVEPSTEAWREWADRVCRPQCDLFLALMCDVICSGNTDHYTYLENLCALTFQLPGIPSEIATVLKGEQGTGKGTFVRGIGEIFGRHFIHLDRTEQLSGKFNASLSGKVVVFADEAFFAGDKSSLGSLKRLITEPTLAIERKGIDIVQERNCIHLFMATNNDFAHQAGMKERRFFTLHVSGAHQQDYAYFNAIKRQLDAGGRAALLSYFLTRAIDHDLVRQVPRTDELRIQQEQSLEPEMRWWRDCLYHGRVGAEDQWPEYCTSGDLYSDYLRWCDAMKVNRRLSEVDLVRRVLAPWLLARVQRGGKWVRPLLPLIEARGKFDLLCGTSGAWEDEPAAGNLAQGSEEEGPRKDLPF
jgi:hypothetical protein